MLEVVLLVLLSRIGTNGSDEEHHTCILQFRGKVLPASEHGGHVGFVSGTSPLRPVYWCEDQIVEFITGN